jgi:hypothetical protein
MFSTEGEKITEDEFNSAGSKSAYHA